MIGMITIVELQAKIEAAVADFEAGLYQSAITKALAAGMLLIGIPDTQFDLTDQVRFDRRSAREQIDALVKNCRMMLAAQSGPAESPVRYERG